MIKCCWQKTYRPCHLWMVIWRHWPHWRTIPKSFSRLVSFTMIQKLSLRSPLAHRKEGLWGRLTAKKSQLPPLFPTPHREADLGHNEDELTLRDVRHSMPTNPRLAVTTAKPHQHPVNTRNQWQPRPFSEVAQPRAKAREAFNKGQCADGTVHPADLHVCRYCLHMVNRLCHHTEWFGKRKGYTQNQVGGIK